MQLRATRTGANGAAALAAMAMGLLGIAAGAPRPALKLGSTLGNGGVTGGAVGVEVGGAKRGRGCKLELARAPARPSPRRWSGRGGRAGRRRWGRK